MSKLIKAPLWHKLINDNEVSNLERQTTLEGTYTYLVEYIFHKLVYTYEIKHLIVKKEK